MEEDKKTLTTIGLFFGVIAIVVVAQLFLALYLQSIYWLTNLVALDKVTCIFSFSERRSGLRLLK